MNDFDEDDVGIGYRDLLMGVVGLFTMLLLAIMLWVHDPQEKNEGQSPPGDIVVSVFWPNGPIDVDTWLDGPGEPDSVGFSNKSGVLWNLLRDDLGITNDASPLNFENAFTRGSPPGRYTVNLHCFHCDGPVTVYVKIEMKSPAGVLVTVYEGNTVLEFKGDQKTVKSFVIDNNGHVVEQDNVFRDLLN